MSLLLLPDHQNCPACGIPHERNEPHELNNLFYFNFLVEHGREPTQEDTTSHLDLASQMEWYARQLLEGYLQGGDHDALDTTEGPYP